ncbi:hypothetical protein BASA50_000755 [Batrachochytrium salamandrivorans]|uniref:Uncharacterized protein n=1 Tax=Batrachochytrium salamandrivorans TaxID=1357716 RepID=A0ABQ8ETW4_9FUNG|nr:hypothetical protein BASA50_000755 [Batrachochytrium salamandrivorans]
MQLFYLLSFVGVVSHAAALPQPAGLSEQYSNNADTTLASILEARSYQPVVDTRKDSPTLVSLERRANSAGSPRINSGFSTPPLSVLSYEEAKDLIYKLFKKSDFSFANISSTIEKVGDGIAELSENGEKVKTKIVGPAGALLARYLSRAAYVTLVLTVSPGSEGQTIISFIRSTTPSADFPKVITDYTQTSTELILRADEKEKESYDFIVNMLKDTGTVLQNVEDAIKASVEALDILVKLFEAIKTLMGKSESGKDYL